MDNNSTVQEMIFEDIERKQIPVRIGNRQYILLETSGDAEAKWRNALFKATKVDEKGRPFSWDGMADCDPLLVSLCLYHADSGTLPVNKDGDPDPRYLVSLQRIRSWPHRIQRDLADKIKEISGLKKEDTAEEVEKQIEELQERLSLLRNGSVKSQEQEAKNLPEHTEHGSS